MPQVPKGHFRRSRAGRFLYGAVSNYRTARATASLPRPDVVATSAYGGDISPLTGAGAPNLTVTFDLGPVQNAGPVALSGAYTVSDGTRTSWPASTVTGAVNVSLLPVQGGYVRGAQNVDDPTAIDGSTVANQFFPRTSETSPAPLATATEVIVSVNDPAAPGTTLDSDYDNQPTYDYPPGTFEPDISAVDMLTFTVVAPDVAEITVT